MSKKSLLHLLVLFTLNCAVISETYAQTTSQSVVVTGSGSTTPCVGQDSTYSFNATVSGSPDPGKECTLNGPTWTWTITGASGTMSTNGSSASITVNFNDEMTYNITATATVSYTTTGSDCNSIPSVPPGSSSISNIQPGCCAPVLAWPTRHGHRELSLAQRSLQWQIAAARQIFRHEAMLNTLDTIEKAKSNQQ